MLYCDQCEVLWANFELTDRTEKRFRCEYCAKGLNHA